MIKGKLILFVTMSLWNEPHRGRHHFADLLANDNIVIWVDRFLSWRESNKNAKIELKHIERGLYVLHTSYSIFPNRLDYKINFNNWFRLRLVLKLLKKNGFKNRPDLIWIYDYRALQFVYYFKNKSKCIYFCNDYFGEYAYSRYESKIAKMVDFVFCTSLKLKERLIKFNPNCYFIPHGVWLSEKPTKFIKKKQLETVGYIGTLRNAINIEFLWKILKYTNLKIIIGGPIIECDKKRRKDFKELFKHNNVFYLGEINNYDLIRALDKIDICLLPYNCDYKSEFRFPIKYFEYLSVGKPIVATPFKEWSKHFDRFVNVFKDSEDLNEYFKKIYFEWNEDKYQNGIDFAKKSTWSNRLEEISKIIKIN